MASCVGAERGFGLWIACAVRCASKQDGRLNRVWWCWTARVSRPPKGGERGFDGHKRVKGRKRQLLVDTLGGKAVLRQLPWTPRLNEIRADGGCDSPALADWCQQGLQATLSLTQPAPQQKGFVVQRGRWVVERTFAWFGRYRRLSKDYEQTNLLSEGFVYIASLHILVRRLAR